MNLAERMKIVPVGHVVDLNTGATQSCDSINMKDFHKCTFIILLGTLAGADFNFLVYSGATDGALDSACYFKYAYGGAAIGSADCDKLASETVGVATLLVPNASKDNFMLVIEVEAEDMDMVNQEEWLTLVSADVGGATGTYEAIAILEPRYTENRSPSALV